MYRILKIIGLVIGIVILLTIVGLIALAHLIDPNQFKPFISDKIYLLTGKTATFKGPIHWSIFPTLGFQFNDIELANPSGFGESNTFLEIHKAKAGIKLLPLLHKKIETNDIVLNGLTLNLVQNKSGKKNWENTVVPKDSQGKTSSSLDPQNLSQTQKNTSSNNYMSLAIPNISVKNTDISWLNLKNNQFIKISRINVSLHDIRSGQPINIQATFEYQNNQPKINGAVSFSTTLLYTDKTQTLELRNLTASIQLTSTIAAYKNLTLLLRGNFKLSPYLIKSDSFTLETPQQKLITGEINVTSQKPLNEITQKNAIKTISSISAQGKLIINNLAPLGFSQINQVQMTITGKNGLLTIPISANVYQGTLNGQLQTDVRKPNPSVTFSSTLNKIQVKPLLADLADEHFLSGVADATMTLSANPFNNESLIRSLNGTLKFSVYNGGLEGIDLVKFMQLARGITHPISFIVSKPTGETLFKSLTGSAVISNGILTNRDLYISSKVTDVKGYGTINLVNKQIHYTLEANQNTNNLVGSVPLEITGTFENYSVFINVWKLLKSTVEKNVSTLIDKASDNVIVNTGKGAIDQVVNKTLKGLLQ